MPSAKKLHAWIETDLPLGGGRAILATGEPVRSIAGTRADWPLLREFLGPTPAAHCPDHLPGRAAVGYFTYDGDFWFGLHDHVEFLPESTWPPSRKAVRAGTPRSSLSPDEFRARVRRIHDYIRAGDVYQVNLTRTIRAPFAGCPRALFSRLRAISPAPFAAFLEAPGRTIVSASPELFLRTAGPVLETRPIKGTRPRFQEPSLDHRAAEELVV